MPNTLGGAQLFVQAHSLWVGSPNAIPLANLSGQSVVLPQPQTTKVVGIARIFNHNGGPSAVEGYFTINPASSIGYGLVTEFQ